MNLETLLSDCPDYAKDLKLNISSTLRQTELTPQQAWGTAVSSAIASRNPKVLEAILEDSRPHLSPEALNGARAAAAVMGMNNIFYRFTHLTENDKYRSMPARLRMNIIRTHGADPVDFELWCTAVSAIHGCGTCITAHERVLREKGVTEETITAAIRIASVVHALACLYDSL